MTDSTNSSHDFSLHSGERQIASTYDEIRADHRYRYEWADNLLPPNGFGLDIFCGNGYGTWLTSKQRIVWGIDASGDAIRLAENAYGTSRAFFSKGLYPFDLPNSTFDFIISLESVEHVINSDEFFRHLVYSLKPGGHIVFSTPCEDELPLSGTGNHFHHKHYKFDEVFELINSNNLTVLNWAGQDAYQILEDGRQGPLIDSSAMNIKPKKIGQFLIFHCIKKQSCTSKLLRAIFKFQHSS